MKRDEIINIAKERGWLLTREDTKTYALFFVKENIQIVFWMGKDTFGICPKGKRQHFIRHLYEEQEWRYVFDYPLEAWQDMGYRRATEKNRNRFIHIEYVNKNI